MQRYLVRRLVLAVITLLAVSLIIFILSRSAGDPVSLMLDEYSTQEDIDRMMAKLGTDKPYYQQYFIFLRDAPSRRLRDVHQGRASGYGCHPRADAGHSLPGGYRFRRIVCWWAFRWE